MSVLEEEEEEEVVVVMAAVMAAAAVVVVVVVVVKEEAVIRSWSLGSESRGWDCDSPLKRRVARDSGVQ